MFKIWFIHIIRCTAVTFLLRCVLPVGLVMYKQKGETSARLRLWCWSSWGHFICEISFSVWLRLQADNWNPGLSRPQPHRHCPLITLMLYHLVIAVDVGIEQLSAQTNERLFLLWCTVSLCTPNEWSSEGVNNVYSLINRIYNALLCTVLVPHIHIDYCP